jgi:hypothetical protein
MEECTEHQRFVEIEMSSQLDGDVLRMEWKEMRMFFGKLPDARWLSEFLTLFGA